MDFIEEHLANLASSYNISPEEILDVYLRAARKYATRNHYHLDRLYDHRLAFTDQSGVRVDTNNTMTALLNSVHEMLRQTARERASRWPLGVHQVRVLRDEREFLAVESLDSKLYGVIPQKFRSALHPAPGAVVLAMAGRANSRILSMTDTQIVAYAFKREVPEIADGTVQIVKIARLPGVRSKVAVRSTDSSVNAIGACVGQHAARISAVRHALDGETIDVIPYHDDIAQFISAAFAPVKVQDVDLANRTAHIFVESGDMMRAIGRQGDNARLVAMLTGYKVDIRSAERRAG